jgi:predicted secreted protein with PEFG-CTERM motif
VKRILVIGLVVMLIVVLPNLRSIEAVPSGFSNPLNISSNLGDSILPQMAVSGNEVYILWNDNATGQYGIFLTKSTDGGTSFGVPVNISKNIGSSGSQQFAVSGNDVCVVWQATATGKYQILFAKSTDGGATFTTPVNLSNNLGDSSYPKVLVSGNNIYVTWAFTVTNKDYDILFTKSADGGATFTTPVNLSNTVGDTGLPQMTMSGDNIYITWENNGLGNFDVFVAKSADSGNTFSAPVNVSKNPKPSGAPQIVASGNVVYVVWMDNTPGNYDIFVAKSTDNASTFETPVNVSNTAGDSGYPQMTLSENNLYVVWTETISKSNYDVLFAKSTDGGATFTTPVNISKNVGASGWAQVAVSGNIYVIWEDNTPGNYDILISKSTDGGATFITPVNISNTPDDSNFKQMVLSGNNVYVVWQDGAPNQHEILFAKSTTFVPEFGTLASLVLLVAMLSTIILFAKTIPHLKMNSVF